MGTLTLTVFRTRLWLMLEHHTDVDPSMGIAATDLLDSWINEAYHMVAHPSTFRHMETETTSDLTMVLADDTYTLPSTIWASDHIQYVGQGFSLRRMTRREMSNRTIGSGRATEYSRWNRTIYLNNAPSSNEVGDILRVYGWSVPTVLTAGSETTTLLTNWDSIILEWAASAAWNSLGDVGRADYHRERFAARVNELREVLAEESRDTGGDFSLDYVSIQDTMRRV